MPDLKPEDECAIRRVMADLWGLHVRLGHIGRRLTDPNWHKRITKAQFEIEASMKALAVTSGVCRGCQGPENKEEV